MYPRLCSSRGRATRSFSSSGRSKKSRDTSAMRMMSGSGTPWPTMAKKPISSHARATWPATARLPSGDPARKGEMSMTETAADGVVMLGVAAPRETLPCAPGDVNPFRFSLKIAGGDRSIWAVRRRRRASLGARSGGCRNRTLREVPMARSSDRPLLVLVLALFLASIAAPAAAQSGDPIRIGVIQPLSGPVAASGNYVRMGAEIARDWINARGGVLGRPVQLLIEDNKSDPKEAATAAEKLIVRDKVSVIMGAWGSSMTLAAMPKLEEYGVPMVVETSSAASITKRGNPWIFRISPPSEMEALGL